MEVTSGSTHLSTVKQYICIYTKGPTMNERQKSEQSACNNMEQDITLWLTLVSLVFYLNHKTPQMRPRKVTQMVILLICTESFFNYVDRFTALCFMGTGALLAERNTRILPMNQYA